VAPHRLRPGVKHTHACFSGVNTVNASVCAQLKAVAYPQAVHTLLSLH